MRDWLLFYATKSKYVHHDAFQIFIDFYIFQLNRHQLTSSPLFADGLETDNTSPDNSLQERQETVDEQTVACMDRCETILRLFLSLRESHYQVSRLWLLVHICLGCSFFLASNLNKARSRVVVGQDLELEHSKGSTASITRSGQRSGTNYSVHPHQSDILKTLKHVIGITY